VEAWQDDPGAVVLGGGSSPGGPDHLFPMQLASAVDVDPRDLTYVPYDGGGPLTSALLGKKIDVGFSGVGEFEGQLASGELRLLAVSGEERLEGEGIDQAPTLTEAGIDLVFTNWRGVFAPPGISEERRDELIAMLEEMHGTPEWRQALEDNGWIDEFKTGDDFTTFLQEQDERVATTLEELDLL
jgi:putative tricarboxylic transport membrane protein